MTEFYFNSFIIFKVLQGQNDLLGDSNLKVSGDR